jgi:hypothetical protein
VERQIAAQSADSLRARSFDANASQDDAIVVN